MNENIFRTGPPAWSFRAADRVDGPAVPKSSPGRGSDYDSFAEAYMASNENNLINAYYERPAMLALAGGVAGRRILDAGCGAGPMFAALRDRSAIVTPKTSLCLH